MSVQRLIADFTAKWGPGGGAHDLNEEQRAQQHFIAQAHETLAAAVPYGWPDYTPQLPVEDFLRRLLALNRERAAG